MQVNPSKAHLAVHCAILSAEAAVEPVGQDVLHGPFVAAVEDGPLLGDFCALLDKCQFCCILCPLEKGPVTNKVVTLWGSVVQ